ncbi:MAG TPA: NapC/NirT family cytochrome c, partial [Candidatus Sulfomarinibacteraceae bacterium]|nr:NapC/NirT family cytochrome c [Candidatus Sulfomarinibacteraceae bacterium]
RDQGPGALGAAPPAPAVAAAAAADAADAADDTAIGRAADDAAAEATGAAVPPRRPWYRRLGEFIHPPRTRRGVTALLLVLGAFGTTFVVGATSVIAWTETADFCGRCHTMGPELTAHENGPHSDVTCGECHVSPGVEGWVKAKINGTRQLVEIVLGTFPEPIPPPDHDSLPPPEETCQRCHRLDRVGTAALVTRTQYTDDETNTRQFVGLLIRPGGGDVFDVSRSVHWHVLADVEFRSDDEAGQEIRWVGVTRDDGTREEYIRQDEIRLAEDVRPDLERIERETHARPMDCLSCHNRVGHPLPNPRRSLDAALASGRIDAGLPYIKREAMRLLWSDFSSEVAAEAEIDRLRSFYELRYPEVARYKPMAINNAIEEIKVLYRLTATPIMRVTATTYPDNLGHTDFAGCFRCHDGGHFLVENGAATTKTIPSSCDTCHTFPQIGAVASLPLGIPPDTHDDRLWVFSHRLVAPAEDPTSNSCGECHARDYCVNCHVTGAVTVDHDQMLTNHAESIRTSGAGACAYCHQPVYCARCHTEQVLPGSAPIVGAGRAGRAESPPGLRWPLVLTADRR